MSVEKKTIRSDIPNHQNLLGPAQQPVADETRRLVVGRGISLSGDISACEHLVVEGALRADRFTARRIDILEPGLFTGMAEVQDAVIAGRFEGRLHVAGRLTIRATGRIFGEISYGALEIEAGAKIEGQLSPIVQETAEQPAARADAQTQTMTASNVESLFDTKDDGEDEGEGEGEGRKRPRVFRRAVGY